MEFIIRTDISMGVRIPQKLICIFVRATIVIEFGIKYVVDLKQHVFVLASYLLYCSYDRITMLHILL